VSIEDITLVEHFFHDNGLGFCDAPVQLHAGTAMTTCGLHRNHHRDTPSIESNVERVIPVVTRDTHDVLVSIAQLLTEQVTELRHIRAVLAANGSVSSVQLEQDSKGQVKLTVKAYENSDVEVAGTAALDEFGRLFRLVAERQMAGWAETVEMLHRDGAA